MSAIAADIPSRQGWWLWLGPWVLVLIMSMGFLASRNGDPGGGACAQADYTPGGADGQGGCFPDASSTGPTGSLTAYGGGCTISSNGTTIDSKEIDCEGSALVINANNVTITNSYITGTVDYNGKDLVMTDVEIDATPTPDTYVTGYTFDGDDGNVGSGSATFLRVEFHGGRSNFYCPRSCSVTDSYSHGVEIPQDSDAHMSAFRFEENSTFRHNSIFCDFGPPTPVDDGGCSADLTGYPDFAPIHHLTVDNNLFGENEWNAYCGYFGNTTGKPFSSDPLNATHISVTNNVFQKGVTGKCASGGDHGNPAGYAATTDFDTGEATNTWTGNIWDDGTTINANQ